MGENSGTTYILLAFIIILAVGIYFANSFDIQAFTFFRGVS